MPRRKREFKRKNIVTIDPVYGSELLEKFTNVIMWRGKKNTARKIVYGAIDELIKKTNGDKEKALVLFQKAFTQIIPVVEVRSRRVGGSVYQIPVPVKEDRGLSLAFRWLINAAASRPDKTMGKRIARELLDASEGRGGAIKKKTDVHRMAEANRAFAHFAW